MLIDMHAHTSGISRCCKRPAEEIVEIAKAAGIEDDRICVDPGIGFAKTLDE